MANERGHPKLSYEVLKAEFHPQVAEKIGNYVSKGPAPRKCYFRFAFVVHCRVCNG